MVDYNSLQPGQMIDVKDTESIWCQGTIEEIYQKVDKAKGKQRVVAVLIHYRRWHKIYN